MTQIRLCILSAWSIQFIHLTTNKNNLPCHLSHKTLARLAYMSRVVRKPAFCICKNKDADQLHVNSEADQCLCFRYKDSTLPLLPKYENFKPLVILCGCTAWFVTDQLENQNVSFLVTRLIYNFVTTSNYKSQCLDI